MSILWGAHLLRAQPPASPYAHWSEDGYPIHVMPTLEVLRAMMSPTAPDEGVPVGNATVYQSPYPGRNNKITEHGGSEMSNAGVVAVYWNTAVASSTSTSLGYTTVKDQMSAFVTAFSDGVNWHDVAATTDYTIVQQYGSATAISALLANRGSYVDSQATLGTISDASIRSYLANLFNAGALAASADNIYAMFFPPGMQVTLGAMASCSQFCGYHSYCLYGGQQIKYVVMPYLDCSGCTYAGTSVADHLTTAMSHEIREAVTDADVQHGWWDSATGDEADDKCNAFHVYQMSNGGFWVQPEWSNGGTVTASGFTATYPGPGCLVPSGRVTAPSFASQPLNWFVTAGQNAQFWAVASGTPVPTYQWQLSADGGSSWTNVTETAPYSGVTTPTLTVTAATPSLNGAKYRCLVTNSAGSALSNTATLSVDGTFTVLHAFAGSPDGYWPVSLVQATDGSFYGSTSFGGSTLCSSGCGTIFRMNAAGATSTLYAFSTGSVGTHPNGGLMQAADGNFYGTTCCNVPLGTGAVFRITSEGAIATVRAFTRDANGSSPFAGVVQGTDGNFYGTTTANGAISSACPTGCGTIFRITPGGVLTVLHTFTGTDGKNAVASLLQAADGNFYGTTREGGAFGVGTIFRIAPSGAFVVLHDFAGGADGANPQSALIQATDGNFYGTTASGGAGNNAICPQGCGAIVRMTSTGAVTVLHAFTYWDGYGPSSALLQATDGNFYGVATLGAAFGYGRVFKMTPAGTFSVVHDFQTFDGPDGAQPSGNLIQATDGDLYGMTETGGASGKGVVFRLRLGLGVAPTLTMQPQSQTIAAGQTATLTVAATGTGTLTYQWYVGPSGTTSNPIAGATSSSYTTPTLTSTTSYWVRVSNAYGGANSSTATIAIGAAPSITTQPQSQTVASGETATVAIAATGTGTLTYQWYVGPSGTTLNPIAGATASSYTTPALTATTNYWVRVSNAYGHADSNTATMTVVPCTFRLTPSSTAFGLTGGKGRVDVMTQPSCEWRASTPPEWISMETGGGMGAGALTFTVLPHDTRVARSAAIVVADQTLLVSQRIASGDFDGDGIADMLWRNRATGQNIGWLMNGTTVSRSALLPAIADVNWEIKGRGDFDGDGRADVIWRNKATGQHVGWLMDGLTVTAAAFMPTIADTNWEIKGVGDFDGDGQADVILRNKVTGQNIAWLMDGLTVAFSAFLPTIADTHWDIRGVGDFDGDRKADVILRNTVTGQRIVWLMEGAGIAFSAFLPTIADTNWDIAAVADLNGDGKADVVLRNAATGQNIGWLMNGPAVSVSAFLAPMTDTNWEIKFAGHLNGDGNADLVWRNKATGENRAWLMNGLTIASTSSLITIADTNWEIAGR